MLVNHSPGGGRLKRELLLIRVGLLVAIIRIALWVRPWPGVLRLVRWLPSSVLSIARSRDFSADDLVWAVATSSRLVPFATCLTQSLALQCVLVTSDRSCRVQIGVAKDARGKFQSHAWVEHDGHPLLSTPVEVMRYARLLTVQGAPSPHQ